MSVVASIDWLNALPDESVVAAYDPDLQAAPGHKVGTSWMWRKEHGEWIIVGGGFHAAHYVARHPNLTLVYSGSGHGPSRVGAISPDLLRELDTRGAQAKEAVEQ